MASIGAVTEAVPPLGLARYRGSLPSASDVTPARPGGLLARLPMGMVGLALFLLVRESAGSYAAAGRCPALLRGDRDRSADRGRSSTGAGRRGPCSPAVIFPALLLGVVRARAARRAARAIGAVPRGRRSCRPSARRSGALAADVRRLGCAPPRTRSRPRCRRSTSSSAPTRRAADRRLLAGARARRRGGDRRCRDDADRARRSRPRVAAGRGTPARSWARSSRAAS